MTTANEIDLLLNEIEINCNPEIGSVLCNSFALDCLGLIREKLPPIAAEATELLPEYLSGRVALQIIDDILLKCWHYVDESSKITDLSREVNAVRAVIFPLNAQKHPTERDALDYLTNFLALINQVEPHFNEEKMLLHKYFAKCLKAG